MPVTLDRPRRNVKRRAAAAFAAAGLLAVAACAEEGEYPTGTVEMMIPWTAGGGSDLSTRQLANHLENQLGVTITPVNEPGANGALGWGSLAEASTDGYELGLLTFDVLSNEVIDPTSPTIEDFDIIAQFEQQALFLYVRADSEYDDVTDLEDGVMFGTSGLGGIDHQAPAALSSELGVEWDYTPFDGHADGLTNLLGGNIDAFVFTPNIAAQYVDDGTLEILGTFSTETVEQYPDVPTFTEMGLDVPPIGSFRGIAAPAGIDPEIRDTVEDAIRLTLEDEDFIADAQRMQMTPYFLDGAEFEDYMNELRPTITEVLTEMGLAQE